MATTTYEEEKKRVERPADLVMPTYAPPTNTATQQAYADSEAMIDAIRQRYADVADPARQAEQDAKIQRGRQFWTGANLFANVIANAINANGTAKGAPNMTWNDASTQKMYETWKDADARLRADRKEAQQRYDAMGLQQQQMRLAAAQAQDAAAQKAYDMNFGLQKDATVANWNRQNKEYDTQQTQDYQDKVRQQANQDKIDFYEYQRRHPMPSRSGGGSSRTSTKAVTDHSVQLGSIDIPAKDEKDAQRIRRDVANKIVDRMNAEIEKRNKEKKVTEPKDELIAKPKNDKEAQAIIYQSGDLYDDDTDFRKDINSTYGIEDIYAEEAVPNQVYQMPSYQPRYGQGVYSTPSAAAPASSASASGVGQRGGQYQDGGYFLGSKQNAQNVDMNAGILYGGSGNVRYAVEGSRHPFMDFDLSRNSGAIAGEIPGGGYGREDRYVGTQRAPHELTEEEKELIKKNGEKPKINY